MKDLRLHKLWFGIGLAMMAVIACLSLIPTPQAPVDLPHFDKVEHALAYGALMFWFTQLYVREKHLYLLCVFVLFGGCIELLQGMSGYRSGDFADLIADLVGLLLAWSLGKTSWASLLSRIEVKILAKGYIG